MDCYLKKHRTQTLLLSLFIGVATFAVYILTMPPTVVFEDDGFFILSSFFNGVSHPPGYPLHSLIGHIFTKIPIGTVAQRVHAVSALFGALTAVMVFRITILIAGRASTGCLAAFGYAFSEKFWSQAIIAEVYTLNTFICFSLIYLALKFNPHSKIHTENQAGTGNGLIVLSGLLLGFGLANHWPLVILSIPGIALLCLGLTPPKPFKTILFLSGMLIGLTPYIWMFFNSQTNPEFSFLGSIDTIQELINYILRKIYKGTDKSQIAGIMEKFQYSLYFFNQYILQFTLFGFALSLAGFFALKRYMDTKQLIGIILIFSGNSLILIWLLGFEYNSLYMSVISVYFLTAYGLAAITMALGYDLLLELVPQKYKKLENRIPILNVSIVLAVFICNFAANNRSRDNFAEIWTQLILNELPHNAILIANSDMTLGPIGYIQYIENVRPDVNLINCAGLLFNNRLYAPQKISPEEAGKIVDNFILKNIKNIYAVKLMAGYKCDEYFLYCKPQGPGDIIHPVKPDKNIINFYEKNIVNNHCHDAWTSMVTGYIRKRFIPYFLGAARYEPQNAEKYLQYIDEATSSFEGMLYLLNLSESNDTVSMLFDIEKLNNLLDEKYRQSIDRRLNATYCNYKARYYMSKNEITLATKYIELSLKYNPEETNRANKLKHALALPSSALMDVKE